MPGSGGQTPQSSPPTSGGTKPVEEGTGGASYQACTLIPTEDTGWVAGATNTCALQGAWFAYNDCSATQTDCTKNQRPDLSAKKFENVAGKMCTSGTTAAIHGEYSLKWGAGIGLNLNQPIASDTKNRVGDLAVAVKGFSFNLSANTLEKSIRVTFPTPDTEKTAHFVEVGPESRNYTVLFANAKQDSWVTSPVPLVAGDVIAIQFQIQGEDDRELPFDFCIEDLKALY
jgi:hypothetical protein